MQLTNTQNRYGSINILLHWVMAILIIGMLALGIYMTGLPNNALKLKLFGWHKEFGILVLMLVCVRIVWRISNVLPSLPTAMPYWEQFAARFVHWLFYLLMFAMPITGWLVTSAAGIGPSFFGLFVLPTLVAPDEKLLHLFAFIHKWLGYGLIAIICGHVAAALKHHFINKDDVLRRIFS